MPNLAVVAHTEKLTKSVSRQLKAALADHGVAATWYEIEKGSAATAAAKKAIKHGADVVLACGGDGTVRAASQALVGTDVALAVMPAGTANLFASALDLPSKPADIVELILSSSLRTLDTGVCNDMTFNVMAGAGFDAAMIDSAEDDKEKLGTLAYLRAGAKQARGRKPFAVEVTIDGSCAFEGSATCVLVGNIGTLKGGVEAFPDASPTDGKLDIGVITASGAREWVGLMVTAVRHKQRLSGHAHLSSGTEVSMRFDTKHRFELDGGVKGRTKRLDFTIKPSSLVVCAPAAA